MYKSTRKLMMMHKALHPVDDIDRLYMSKQEGERGLTNIEENMDASRQGLRDYIKKSKKRLIIVTRNSTGNIEANRTTITKKQK